MECVSQTPMVVTFDDMSNLKVILLNKFKIKVWDIRKYSCIQTIVMDSKINIFKILDLHEN